MKKRTEEEIEKLVDKVLNVLKSATKNSLYVVAFVAAGIIL